METVLEMDVLSVSSIGVHMYIVYKTTNKLTGEFYIGCHKLGAEDNYKYYYGSGVALKNQIALYGKAEFVRETLETFDDREEALLFEHQLINRFRHDTNCLNKSNGGQNFDKINDKKLNNKNNNCSNGGKRNSELLKTDKNHAMMFSEHIKNGLTPEIRENISKKLMKTH